MAIDGFKSGRLKRFFDKDDARRLPKQHLERITYILKALHEDPKELLRLPAYRMHQLKGSRRGEWSVKVSGNLRITFRIKDNGDVDDIDLVDYH